MAQASPQLGIHDGCPGYSDGCEKVAEKKNIFSEMFAAKRRSC